VLIHTQRALGVSLVIYFVDIDLTNFQRTAQEVLTHAVQSIHRHPHRLAAAVAALLLSMGGGAFALASIESNSKELVVREILEDLVLPSSTDGKQAFAALPALPIAPLTLFRTTTTRANDTAETLLKRLGVFDSAAAAYLRSSKELHQVLLGRTGRLVSVEANGSRGLQKLTARWVNKDADDSFQRLIIEKTETGFTSSQASAPLQATQALGSATISSSLFAATDEANIPDAVAVQLADIFSGQIDFRRSLRKGDRLSVVYEALQADGETMRSGKVLSAEFVNNGKSNQAVLFQDGSSSKGQYYTFEGQSLRKAFLASPLEFTRMSSGYGIRVHPITNDKRAHKGIDYAAPTGTPIRTVGDGVVEFASTQRGYGNVIEIKHRDGKSTLFAHLSRIGVTKGQKVEQGDIIGAVGSTGFSTGPHLHFEFRIDGEHRDPLTIVAEGGGAAPLSAAAKPAFDRASVFMRGQLAQAATVRLASAQ
jgi:murein DD-endopeptidase MepM/ murein hydrolase activator NlpD